MIRRAAATALVLLLAAQHALAAPALGLGAPGVAAGAAGGAGWSRVREAREPTAGQISARERQRKCGAEWKEAKAANKLAAGQKWPQFWSACNKRLKGGTA